MAGSVVVKSQCVIFFYVCAEMVYGRRRSDRHERLRATVGVYTSSSALRTVTAWPTMSTLSPVGSSALFRFS